MNNVFHIFLGTYDDLTQVMSYASHLPDNPILKDTELKEIRILYRNYKFYNDINFFAIV
jgi:hypothetical protein